MSTELAPEEIRRETPRRNLIGEIMRANAHTLGPQPGSRSRMVRDISECGTAAKGGRKYICDGCGHQRIVYNSCRNRHCPSCLGYKSAAWLEARREDLLPVQYFHVVFTIPSQLALLALFNKKVVYSILFAAVNEAMFVIGRDPKHLGADIGFLAILHTWSQRLTHHPHIHCVVPGGGISKDGTKWIACRPGFFLPVKALARYFRRVFLEKLMVAYRKGELVFPGNLAAIGDEETFGELLKDLWRIEWVVYSKPPFGSPERVLKYLARYTHRVAISNRRIVRFEDNQVSFRYRDSHASNRIRLMTISGAEFVRRLMLHALPKGFVRIRHCGFLATSVRKKNLELCRSLLGMPVPEPTAECVPHDCCRDIVPEYRRPCPRCPLGLMILIARLNRYDLFFQKIENSS